MMKNKKITILLIILLAVFIILFTIMIRASINSHGEHCSECKAKHVESNDEIKEIDLLSNMNMENYIYHDYIFTDMLVLSSQNLSEFQGYVVNNNPNTDKDLHLKITLYNKENKKIYSFTIEIYNVKFGERRDFFSEITKDVSSAYSFELEEY